MNNPMMAATTRMPPIDMAARRLVRMAIPQMIGIAKIRIATTTTQVDHFFS